jgi:glycosyltransferase involved in cell wall biosynthesis
MKIVHVETGRHLYGGPQQVIYLCHGLLGRGVQSVIVCVPGSAIDSLARQHNIPVHNIVCGGDLDLRFAFRLRSYLLNQRPDIVHCHSRRGADFLGGRAASMASIPAVLSRRVDSSESAFVAARRYSPFCKVIAISDNVAQELRESGLDSGRITVIRSAVDVDALAQPCKRQQWLREFNLCDDHVVAVIAAQLIGRKGHRFVLQAMPDLCRAQPHFRLILFGKGPLEPELRAQAAQLGIANHVQFGGFRDDMDHLLGCADMLIHPAIREGLGVVMLKAAAAGLPVVAFNVAGAREAVVDKQTGLLANSADASSLLQLMTQLVENPEERRRMGAAGQLRMRESFSVDEMINRHVSLYESVLNEQ